MENIEILLQYWLKQGYEKWKTAESLMTLKRYADALFFCHLSLELEFKALITIEKRDYPPFIHDLLKLVSLTDLPLTQKQIDDLEEITTFNIRARYDDYKSEFYKKATKAYAEKYFQSAQELRIWTKKHIQSKQQKEK
jgi:HEPN domain-containing protein